MPGGFFVSKLAVTHLWFKTNYIVYRNGMFSFCHTCTLKENHKRYDNTAGQSSLIVIYKQSICTFVSIAVKINAWITKVN